VQIFSNENYMSIEHHAMTTKEKGGILMAAFCNLGLFVELIK